MSLAALPTLEIVASVIRLGSMSLAAAELGLTQSAVSQAVKRAETLLGVGLLHRTRRPLVATAAGQVLASHLADLSLRADSALLEIRRTGGTPEIQDLRLGMVDTFASAAGPLLIRRLMAGAVALGVTAHSGLAQSHVDALVHHRIDAAVTSDRMEDTDGYTRHDLLREPFVLAVPRADAAALAGLSLREVLLARPLIRYSARSHMGRQIETHLRRLQIEHRQRLSFDTSDALLAMVAGGVGVALTTPLCLLQGGAHLAGLTVLPLPAPGFSRRLTLLTRSGELGQIAPRIARLARGILQAQILPQMVEQLPWLAAGARDMVLGGTDAG